MLTKIKKFLSRSFGSLTAFVMAVVMAAAPMSTVTAAQEVTDAMLKDYAIEVAFLVNEFRAENGLPPVYVVPYLCDTAQVRAREAIFNFSHLRPDGSKFSTVVDFNLIPYDVIFENLAAGYGTPQQTMEAWKKSEKHCEAMLNPNITHMGVGVGYEYNSAYKWYWEQTFIITEEHFANEYIPSRYEIIPQAEGDITGDAVIDTFDYLALTDYIYKTSKNIPVYLNPAQLETADCFRDGIITESDAKALVRYLLGEYDSLPFVF